MEEIERNVDFDIAHNASLLAEGDLDLDDAPNPGDEVEFSDNDELLGTEPMGIDPPQVIVPQQGIAPTTAIEHDVGIQPRSFIATLNESMKLASTMIHDEMRFSGELPIGNTTDLSKLAEMFFYNVNFISSAAVVPDTHQNLVAIRLLKGRAYQLVIETAKSKGEVSPSMDTITTVITTMTSGTAIGPITLTERIWDLDLKDVALRLYKENREIPDLNRCVQYVQQLLSKREKMADPDLVVFWIKFVKHFPQLAADIRLTNIDGCMVEQTNPAALITTLLSHGYKFKELLEMEIKGKQSIVAGPSGSKAPSNTRSGSSKAGWQKPPSKAPPSSKKRPQKVTQSREDPSFNPFNLWRLNQLSATPKDGMLFWIKGSTRAIRSELAKDHKCFLCKSPAHKFTECPDMESAFKAKKFCFFPTSK
jgi:hypothetical protein